MREMVCEIVMNAMRRDLDAPNSNYYNNDAVCERWMGEWVRWLDGCDGFSGLGRFWG